MRKHFFMTPIKSFSNASYNIKLIIMMANIVEELSKLKHFQSIFEEVKPTIVLLLKQFDAQVVGQLDEQTELKYRKQFFTLFKNLNSTSKISILKDQNHRKLVIEFIKKDGVEHYKYSYYNRAKISKFLFKRLQEVGPILFSEAVMIASKVNIINKNSSRIFIQDHLYTQSQNPVDMRIQQILKLCDEKKRNANNNFKKLQLILETPDYLQVIKQLGKMLRDSWRNDKNKNKCTDVVQESVKNHHIYHKKDSGYEQQIEDRQEQKSIAQKSQKSSSSHNFSFASSQKQMILNSLYAKIPKNEYKQVFESDNSQQSLFDMMGINLDII